MYALGEGEEEQEEGCEDADGGEAQEEASGSGLQIALLGSFGTSGQCVFDIVCATGDEILADKSTEVHDLVFFFPPVWPIRTRHGPYN